MLSKTGYYKCLNGGYKIDDEVYIEYLESIVAHAGLPEASSLPRNQTYPRPRKVVGAEPSRSCSARFFLATEACRSGCEQ